MTRIWQSVVVFRYPPAVVKVPEVPPTSVRSLCKTMSSTAKTATKNTPGEPSSRSRSRGRRLRSGRSLDRTPGQGDTRTSVDDTTLVSSGTDAPLPGSEKASQQPSSSLATPAEDSTADESLSAGASVPLPEPAEQTRNPGNVQLAPGSQGDGPQSTPSGALAPALTLGLNPSGDTVVVQRVPLPPMHTQDPQLDPFRLPAPSGVPRHQPTVADTGVQRGTVTHQSAKGRPHVDSEVSFLASRLDEMAPQSRYVPQHTMHAARVADHPAPYAGRPRSARPDVRQRTPLPPSPPSDVLSDREEKLVNAAVQEAVRGILTQANSWAAEASEAALSPHKQPGSVAGYVPSTYQPDPQLGMYGGSQPVLPSACSVAPDRSGFFPSGRSDIAPPPSHRNDQHSSYGHGGSSHVGDPPRRAVNTSIWRLRYDGRNVDLNNYLSQLDCVAQAQGWDDTEKGTVLLLSLEKSAAQVMNNIPAGCVSYQTISQKLRQMFAPASNVVAYKAQFQCRTRGSQEGVHEYSLALRDLAGKAYPRMDHESLEQLVMDQFLRGQPAYVRFALASGSHKELETAVAAAIQIEAYARDPATPEPGKQHGGRRGNQQQPAVAAQTGWGPPGATPFAWPGFGTGPDPPTVSTSQAETVGPMDSAEDPYEPLADVISQLMELDFSGNAQCNAAGQQFGQRPCYYCGKPGHFWMKCRALIEKLRERGFSGRAPDRSGGFKGNPGRFAPRPNPPGDTKASQAEGTIVPDNSGN